MSGDPRAPIGSILNIDYNNIVIESRYEWGPFRYCKKNEGLLSNIKSVGDVNKANLIWKKNRKIIVDSRVLPPIELYYSKSRLKGQRISYELDEEQSWLTVKSRNHEYVFRKTSQTDNEPDFPAFHKMLITQIMFTELINHMVKVIDSGT